MKNILVVFAIITMSICSHGVFAADTSRAAISTSTSRGNQGLANAYRTNQKNTYYMVTQPDVDTACRQKIYSCLSEYCGDVTVVPGQRSGRCTYASEGELYNYALLCLQKDTTILLPQYGANSKNFAGGTNTAARLCPSYVQQELMAYLSMANMAEQLNKSHSSLCVQRRQELEAAMACHSVSLSYGNETSSMLNSQLSSYCGAGIPGGSSEMVSRFANAGNVGANIWGWAEKVINLEMNKKGADWQAAVDAVVAGYANRMNVACGDNVQINTVQHSSGNTGPTSLQTAAALAVGLAFPQQDQNVENPFETWSITQEIQSMSDVFSFATARQVVQAGLTNTSITQNAFLTSSQMDSMQTAYKMGTKVFILRDSARCYIVPVATMDSAQQSLVAQAYANCVAQ